jgi:PAS domain S-box-containing protein
MAIAALRRLGASFLPMVVLSVLLLTSLYLMSAATQNSQEFGRVFFLLLLINVVALVMLLVLIGANLVRLVRQYRSRATGSRLTVRLVIMFVVLSLLPVSVVYYFSLGFIQRGVDSWFDVRIEQALDDTLELTRLSLDERKRDLIKRSDRIAQTLAQSAPPVDLVATINQLRQLYDVQDLTLLDQDGRVLAYSSFDLADLSPALPDHMMLRQLQQQGSYLSQDTLNHNQQGEDRLVLRILTTVPSRNVGQDWVLQTRYPLSNQISHLTDSVQAAFAEYRQLTLLRDPLKFSFTLTLSLVLLLSCLTAVWAAFFAARRLVAPIRALAIGTRAVAAGDYHKQLPQHSHDELGFLVQSFNDMTRRIAQSRDEAESSQLQAERERAYLRAVLGRLSSGVLTLDRRHTIRTANVSSGQVLGIELKDFVGQSLEQLVLEHGWLDSFVAIINKYLDEGQQDWREEVIIFGHQGRKVLMCGGAALPGVGGRQAGHVIVFDDVTALVQAQRDAAWGEVARRLAHEIKNPLTPIQLSAERLRQKYLASLPADEAGMLDRLTHTIIQQVEVMKKMVQAFAEYAYVPQLQLSRLALNDVINEVLDLYNASGHQTQIKAQLDPHLPLLEADSGRIRQLLHNLIKNALEAISDTKDGGVRVMTRMLEDNQSIKIELRIEDDGLGIPEDMLAHIFDPYLSSKPRGSGLGLAIVKKIVEEHAGLVRVYNRTTGGAGVEIQFPVDMAVQDKGQKMGVDVESAESDSPAGGL